MEFEHRNNKHMGEYYIICNGWETFAHLFKRDDSPAYDLHIGGRIIKEQDVLAIADFLRKIKNESNNTRT